MFVEQFPNIYTDNWETSCGMPSKLKIEISTLKAAMMTSLGLIKLHHSIRSIYRERNPTPKTVSHFD
jgi:hypothetical protein